ncbi:hypothetical protein WN990_15235 [Kitasatospora purpeofusca]|uniref:hypothetical protein n=1 Tax=Kitasatospora purpeofusca TaxID=67352 RepID=UPI0030F1B12D
MIKILASASRTTALAATVALAAALTLVSPAAAADTRTAPQHRSLGLRVDVASFKVFGSTSANSLLLHEYLGPRTMSAWCQRSGGYFTSPYGKQPQNHYWANLDEGGYLPAAYVTGVRVNEAIPGLPFCR